MKSILIMSILIFLCSLIECVKSISNTKNKLKENLTNKIQKQNGNESAPESIVKDKESYIEHYKKSLVFIKSRPEVPFITDSEDVLFLLNY